MQQAARATEILLMHDGPRVQAKVDFYHDLLLHQLNGDYRAPQLQRTRQTIQVPLHELAASLMDNLKRVHGLLTDTLPTRPPPTGRRCMRRKLQRAHAKRVVEQKDLKFALHHPTSFVGPERTTPPEEKARQHHLQVMATLQAKAMLTP